MFSEVLSLTERVEYAFQMSMEKNNHIPDYDLSQYDKKMLKTRETCKAMNIAIDNLTDNVSLKALGLSMVSMYEVMDTNMLIFNHELTKGSQDHGFMQATFDAIILSIIWIKMLQDLAAEIEGSEVVLNDKDLFRLGFDQLSNRLSQFLLANNKEGVSYTMEDEKLVLNASNPEVDIRADIVYSATNLRESMSDDLDLYVKNALAANKLKRHEEELDQPDPLTLEH